MKTPRSDSRSKVDKKNEIRRILVQRALLDHGPLSITDLAKMTGMTLPVASNIVSLLKKERLVVQSKEKNSNQAGRPPSIVKLNGAAGFILGIDIGRLFTNFIILDLETNIVGDTRRKSIALSNDIKLIDDLEREIKIVLSEAKVSWSKLLGIGISLPGMVKGREGLGETYFNFGDAPARELLSKRFTKPVHLEHDLEAMAFGERWFGAAKEVDNALCVNIGWGLGLGIIIDGEVYYGENGYAGEFGHIQVVKNGDLCYCGKRGCLETVASGRAITKIARDRISRDATTIMTTEQHLRIDQIDAGAVLKAASQGDQFSIEILEEAGRHLGAGVAILINLLNPALIILGGGVSTATPYLLESVRASAMKHSLVNLNRDVKFTVSSLGNKAGALGVAVYLAEDLFDVERLNPSAYV
ncbi:MAG TPA: ROK family transcriptional regulator [Bacteroidota bacterium]|nr:ROK family transcriptional regulator [Bacteroidota bacterium]